MTSSLATASPKPAAAPSQPDLATRDAPALLALCGVLGALGVAAMLGCAVIAQLRMPEHRPIADTVSALARGSEGWIMDTGLYLHAAGLLALAIGAAHAHLGRTGWSFGLLILALLALATCMIGIFDFFHRRSVEMSDLSVHTYTTYVMYPLYVAGPAVMARGAGKVWPPLRPVLLGCAAASLVLGPVFYLAGDAWDGLAERLLMLPTLLWTAAVSGLLIHVAARWRARAAHG